MSESGSKRSKDEQAQPVPGADAQNNGVLHNGAGADSAWLAMVQTRQMRAHCEDESALPGEETPAKNP